MSDTKSPKLTEAAVKFIAGLPEENKKSYQPVINHFIRWFGISRVITTLKPPEIANYAERLSLSDAGYSEKLEQIRAFLTYIKKEGWNRSNLPVHLRTKKTKAKLSTSGKGSSREVVALTREGYQELHSELEILKEKRLVAIDEVTRAAADKDIRENAPLEAARQEHGRISGRIRDLEEAVKSAIIIGENPTTARKADLGSILSIKALDSGDKLTYTIVSPREVNPALGRISSASPVGKALIGHDQGDIIEVDSPAGRHRYQIIKVARASS